MSKDEKGLISGQKVAVAGYVLNGFNSILHALICGALSVE